MICIAVDDEPLALEILQEFCSRIPFLELRRTFTRTSEAKEYLEKFPVDLLFLDIQMPGLSGVDFYKSLTKEPMVIFTTAYSEYAVEGFNLNAIDYLLKPIEFSRFNIAANKANDYFSYINRTESPGERCLYVRSEYSLVKILLTDILYIETLDDYIKIHLPGKKPVLTLMSMKSVQEKLPAEEFLRVHRSYIVPLHRIESVRGKTINLGVAEIPIGSKYETAFFQAYTRQHFH